MKRNKITAVILSIVMSMSMMMPSIEVMADETSAPSETQKTETVETKEPKATEKQTPKETEKQEPKETEKQEPKETEKQEPKETEKQESKETEKQEPAESGETQITETSGSDEKEPAESKDNGDNPEESNETAAVKGNTPSQSASTPKKNAVTGTCGDNLTWTLEDGTLTISGSGKMTDWAYTYVPWYEYRENISSVVLSSGITSIGSYAFTTCSQITDITIPNSVTSIGEAAFGGCESIKNITIPKGVTTINKYVFSGCRSLTNITIPENVTSIGESAFDNCEKLTSITIPANVTSIEDGAFHLCDGLTSVTISGTLTTSTAGPTSRFTSIFSECKNLKSVTILDGEKTIGSYAFADCSNITDITIPSSVTSIGEAAFGGCRSIKNITIPKGVTTINKYVFAYCESLTDITIPESVTSIGEMAFEGCGKLTSIAIPAKVTSIEDGAFHLCDGLTSVTISGTLTSTEGPKSRFTSIFSECKNIKSVTILDGEKTIGSYAFADCSNITDITIPSSVTSIGEYAFNGCLELKDVYYYGTRDNWKAITISSYNDPLKNAIIQYCATYTITVNSGMSDLAQASEGTTVTVTANAAPSGKVFDKWIVNSGTVSLSNALSSTTSFTMPAENVEVTATYKDVEYTIKVNNGSATPATAIAGTVITLTANAVPSGKFDKWIVDSGTVSLSNASSSTTTFTMPAENVEITAIYKTVPSGTCGDNLTWTLEDGTLTISGSGKMGGNVWYSQGEIPNIPWKEYSENIRSVVFSGNITSIYNYAFYNCSNLTSITVPNSVTSIGDGAFYGCSSLTSIELPDGITSIGYGTFRGCTNLTSIIIPNSVTSIGGFSGGAVFYGCSSLASITIPNSVTTIWDYTFYGCTSLTSITIPNSVTSIEQYAFQECSNLTSITIPDGVTSIGEFAFYKCSSLTSITIPKSVTSIEEYAFSTCTALKDVYYDGTEDDWKNITIGNGNKALKNANIHYVDTYSITVNSGTSDLAKATEGTTVTVTANAAPSGKVFDKWIVDSGTVSLSNASSSTTTFTMPAENVEVTATYKDAEYTIKVNNGSAAPATAKAGTAITLTADAAPSGKVFDKWIVISGNVTFANELSSTTTFTLPAENVEVTATYKDVEYTIKVNNGSAAPATATAGTVITLTADAAPSGKVFDKWIVDSGTVSLSNASSSTTTFTMPAENVEVTATYKDAEYTIKVNNGSAAPATAKAGTVITLTANAAPSGKVFEKWIVVSGTVSFANASSATTTFTMPSENVEVTATYKTVPSGNFIVKVNNGVASPSTSAPGLVVHVTANDAPAGTEFDKWEVVSGTVIFSDSSSATTFFVMPAENVEITAKYKSSLSVKGKTATVKYSKLKKKNQSLDVSKVLTFVDKGQGQLSYAKVSGDSKIIINKTTGKITVKKKLKKKTYTVKVKVMASGNESCNPSEWKTVTFKIKVK